VHESVGRVFVELVGEFSLVLLALWSHVCITCEEVSTLWGLISGGCLRWCLIIVVLVAIFNLHIFFIVLFLLHELVFVVFKVIVFTFIT